MTVAIGFTCRDAIIVASDSQHTFTTSASAKRLDAEKIGIVSFKNNNVLVVQSGGTLYSKRFVELFQQHASDIEDSSSGVIPKIAQQSMHALKNELRVSNGDLSVKELDDLLLTRGEQVECIFAYFSDTAEGIQPFIYTITLAHVIPERVNGVYAAIGCGSSLAEYLLDTHLDATRDDRFCSVVAVHVIETVKKYDAFCGGAVQVAVLKKEETGDETSLSISYLKPSVSEEIANKLVKLEKQGSPMLDRFCEVIAETMFTHR